MIKRAVWFSVVFFSYLQADALLVAVLMVKNEALAMQRTLQPLVDAGVQDFVIYDTGSNDQTIQITQDFFIQNNIKNFVIEQGEWIDFATSRNHALEIAKQHFKDATFILMLDADWILHNGSELLKFCETQVNSDIEVYTLQVKDKDVEFAHPRLIRLKSEVFFVGKVHERLNVKPENRVPSNMYINLLRTEQSYEKSKQRWQRDQQILLEELEKNSCNVVTLYDLGQTCFWLGDVNGAITWYEYYFSLPGIGPEKYSFLMALAQAYGMVGNTVGMINCYLNAFEYMPHRADPLIKLAQYYYSINAYQLCFLFAKQAIAMQYPEDDFGLIERELYDFVRYELISATAFCVGDFQLGKQATLKALAVYPDLKYLWQNLYYYDEQLLKEGQK